MAKARDLGTTIAVRAARSLYSRWRVLGAADRELLRPLAEEAKRRALELRGRSDSRAAERELHAAGETLVSALVERAEADPELDEVEVHRLRDDLRRELDRLAADGGEQRPRAA